MKYEGPSSQMTKYVESNLETGKKENTHTPEGRRERKGRIEEIKKQEEGGRERERGTGDRDEK